MVDGIFNHSHWLGSAIIWHLQPAALQKKTAKPATGPRSRACLCEGLDIAILEVIPKTNRKWMGSNRDLLFQWSILRLVGGGNSHLFCVIFAPKLWGRWSHFDEHIFQRGWKHQLASSKSTWKWMVGIRSFPFAARPIFRGLLLVSGRVLRLPKFNMVHLTMAPWQ